MPAMTRFEAAQRIAQRLTEGKAGSSSRFTAREWQGSDSDPPPVRVYVERASGKSTSGIGYIEILRNGDLSFERVSACRGDVKRKAQRALHGVDIIPEELAQDAIDASEDVVWSGISKVSGVAARIIEEADGMLRVEMRDDVGAWMSADGGLELEICHSAILEMRRKR